jgi:Protein of unknown function (DUF3570)
MSAVRALPRTIGRWRALPDCRRLKGLFGSLLGGLFGGLAAGGVQAATLPDDRAEAMLHVYSGGGVTASGPAFLVRKSLAGRASLTGSYYVDAVSNASVDVLSTASPFRETRHALDLSLETVVRDASIKLGMSTSREPDYVANSLSLDVTQEFFGGMSTLNLGFSRGADQVGAKTRGFFDRAHHWNYRVGLSQVLSPRWIATANLEAVSDEGYLGSPYRAARVFGATVPERVPRTRTSRAIKLGMVAGLSARDALRLDLRHYWDTWDIRAQTLELGHSRHFGTQWLVDTSLRWHRQDKALFYSDNAQAETLYVTRNRQLGTGSNLGIGSRVTYSLPRWWGGRFDPKLSGQLELKRFDFKDYTDLRTGLPYGHNAAVLQVYVSGTF